MPIYFYTPQEEPYGCFSNFSWHGVEIDGVYWRTVEHYFQAQKFPQSQDYQESIRRAATPKAAKNLGRTREVPIRDDWDVVRDDVMYIAVLKKFATHTDIQAILLGTYDETLIEAAPTDWYWGAGSDGTGLNKLGKILMRVRDELSR